MMIAPLGMSMPVKRMPTVWTLAPSTVSSRSLLLAETEPDTASSTSSRLAMTRFSRIMPLVAGGLAMIV
ncbi:hypothetical protein FQZ97_1227600 [compost metagenome]